MYVNSFTYQYFLHVFGHRGKKLKGKIVLCKKMLCINENPKCYKKLHSDFLLDIKTQANFIAKTKNSSKKLKKWASN